MKKISTVTLAIAVLTIGVSMPFAASQARMSNSSMMKKCQEMSPSAMHRNRNCMKMMKAHPDMMDSGSSSMNGGMK